MKIENNLVSATTYFLLPAMLLMPFLFGTYQGYEPLVFFYCIYLGTLYTRILTKPLLIFTALFQALQCVNIGLTDREIYFDQIKSFIESPTIGFNVAKGHFSLEMLPVIVCYLIITLGLVYLVKPLKLTQTKEFTVRLLTVLLVLTAVLTSNIHQVNKHPLIYATQYAQGIVDNEMDDLADTLPPTKIGKDKAQKIVFILGEAQSMIKDTKSIMPNLHHAISKNNAVLFENVTPLGNYTVISTKQIMESVELRDFKEPHTSFLQLPKALNKESIYISSRNLSWGKFEDRINNRFNTKTLDCKDIDPDCALVGGIDDLEVLNKLVLPFTEDKNEFFITWQMNGSHTPLNNKSPGNMKPFDDEYLNSVHYTDHVIDKLRKKLPDNTWIIFVADHTHKYKLSKNTPKVLAFIENTKLYETAIPANSKKALTQLDIVNAIFELQGFEANDQAPTIVNDIVELNEARGIYKSHHQSTRVELKND